MRPWDEQVAHLDPLHRIAELQQEVNNLRYQRDCLIRSLTIEQAKDGFAMELIGRGIRPPDGTQFDRNGLLDG